MQHRRILFPDVGEVIWETFTLPDPCDPHQVIAESLFSLISVGTELALYTGTHIGFTLSDPPFPMMPQRPGYALVAQVTEVGADVNQIQPGDVVMMEAPHGTAAVMDVRRDSMVKLPDHLPAAEGTLIRMADIAMTALRVAPIQVGDAVLVYGLGLVGHLAAQLYRLHGAYPVIGIDLLPNRVETAKRSPAHPQAIIALNPLETDGRREVSRLTGGRGPDVVVEATGNPDVIPLALDLVAEGGRVTLLGSTRGRVEIDAYSQVHRKGVQVIGAHESVRSSDLVPRRWSKKRDLSLLANLFAEGTLSSQGLITHTISPEELPGMYDLLAQKPEDYLGVLVDWQS